jgi:hypothetical protein
MLLSYKKVNRITTGINNCINKWLKENIPQKWHIAEIKRNEWDFNL